MFAQSPTAQADAWMVHGEWAKAAKGYEAYLKKHDDLAVKEKLALCWEQLGEWDKAEQCRTELAFAPGSPPEAKYRLAQLLKRRGKFDAARVWFEKYAAEGPDSLEAFRQARLSVASEAFRKDSLGYEVEVAVRVNSKDSELLPVLHAGNLVFVRHRDGARPAVWQAARGQDGQLGKPRRAPRQRVTDSKARNAFSYDIPGHRLTNLAFVTPRGGMSDSLSTSDLEKRISWPGQIAFSPDGQTMVFATWNGKALDLYAARKQGNKWTVIENLGMEVNTDADEAFPFFTNDSTLFFSSNSDDGMGGYDIYSARRSGGQWRERRREGAPLNSPFNDYGFCMVPGQPVGYFASNRPGGKGKEDIYAYRRFKVMEGQVVDSKTHLPMADVKVEIVDINQKTHYYRTDAQGRFKHYFRAGQEVFAKFFLKDYNDHIQNFSARQVGYDQNLTVTIPMDAIQRFLITGTVTDARTKEPVADATIRLVGSSDIRTFTNKKGEFSQALRPDSPYRAIFFKEGYVPEVIAFTTGPEGQPQQYTYAIKLRKGGFHYLEGRTVDPERDIVVGGANVHFLEGQKEVSSQRLGGDGMFYTVLDADRGHTIIASKEKYLSARLDLPRSGNRADTLLKDLILVPLLPDKVWKTLHFAYGSSNLDSAGQREVAELVYMLQANPEIGLEIIAHTDARGRMEFNQRLSKQRADQLAVRIAAQGIDRKRIFTVGKGEAQLFNNCRDGVVCSEELHAQNRRAEVKVVRLKDMINE